MARPRLRLIDIGANMTDPMFRGIYNGRQAHSSDFEGVLQRAYNSGIEKIIITGGSLTDSKEALQLASADERLYSTVGCHPTRCLEFEQLPTLSAEDYFQQLLALATSNGRKVAAIGECGLDYDRLKFCPKDLQLKYFEKQLLLAERTRLPLFLHCRNAFSDLIDIMKRNRAAFNGGVIHSFDGTLEEARDAIDFGLYIGLNGCSLKSAQNLDVVKSIPVESILLETDAPWCEIRPSHASSGLVSTHFPCRNKDKWEQGVSVKGRNEPQNILQVLQVVASLKGLDELCMAEQVYKNACTLFGWPL